jgi:hypothetical protein
VCGCTASQVKKKQFFFEKKNQKTFEIIKVFWFFFSKKNYFFYPLKLSNNTNAPSRSKYQKVHPLQLGAFCTAAPT